VGRAADGIGQGGYQTAANPEDIDETLAAGVGETVEAIGGELGGQLSETVGRKLGRRCGDPGYRMRRRTDVLAQPCQELG
jgi:hypothetical protein